MSERLDAATLRRAMEIYAGSLRRHREELDSLNVYPVPDGDTGTNLLMTQEAVVAALPPADGRDDLETLGAAIARGSLMGARGNSGVILSQILRGICEVPPPDGAFGPRELAGALRRAADEAYRAVARPVEGTVLTVIREAARAASEAVEEGAQEGVAIAEAALREARSALDRTRDQLPDLREAGVVDAGAKGIVLLLDALSAALAGEESSEPVGPMGPVGQISDDRDVPPLEFPFEVQYLLEADDGAMPALRSGLAGLGDSLVIVGGNGLFNVHVHTDQPDRAVAIGARAGRPRDVQIADLREQVTDCIGGQARAVRVAEQVTALVAVVEGDGLTAAFASLGALVVTGGPANEPSLQRLADAIEAVPADAVLVLPNHENIAPVALEAAESSTKEVLVVETLSIPSGLTAATVFNPLSDVEENATAIREAVKSSGWGELSRADDDAHTPTGSARRGDWIGTVRGVVVSVQGSATEAAGDVGRLLGHQDADVVTLIVGADAAPGEREAVETALREALPDLELQVLVGGQPGSPFVIGIE
jgi:DAK2 domain fusion protein YloV